MSKRILLPAIFVLFLGLGLVLLMTLPLRLVVGDAFSEFEFTEIQGASLSSGDIWLNLEAIPGLTRLNYDWCPGLAPLSWCIDLTSPSFALNGRLSVLGAQTIAFADVHIDALDLDSLGVAGGLVQARVSGQVNTLQLGLGSNCPLTEISAVDALLETSSVDLFGVDTGAHRLVLSGSQAEITGELTGATFTGQIRLSDAQYSAAGEMSAPDSIAPMMASVMRPLGGNRFGWEIGGKLPC